MLPASVLEAWHRLVLNHSQTILDSDVTATPEWCGVLANIFLEDDATTFLLVINDSAGAAALLPVHIGRESLKLIKYRRLRPLTEFHAGRCGFLLRDETNEQFDALLDSFSRLPPWDVFSVTLVRGSRSATLLENALAQRHYRYFRSAETDSCFIDMQSGWDTFYGSLDTKFRSQLRNREKKLKARGEVTYEHIEKGVDVSAFLDAVFEIEQDSWKESAGTSVTSHEYQIHLYRSFVPIAAERGWLSAHLLRLNGEPIAYLLGLSFNGVFCGLKHTFKDKYRDLTAGHLIQLFALKTLFERGNRLYDFMGTRDLHKLSWTKHSYSRVTYVVYNRTVRGRLAWLAQHMKTRLSQIRSSISSIAVRQEPMKS